MKTLEDSWVWYEGNRRLLKLIGRLGRLYWNDMPWGGKLGIDDNFRLLEGVEVDREAQAVLAEFDDFGIFVLFSVFEANLRIFVHAEIDRERTAIRHAALKRAVQELLDNIDEGSFYANVLSLYKDVDHDRVEEVSQIRKYRNWVAHGRQEGKKPLTISPKDAYDRLQAFLELISWSAPPVA